MLSIEIESARGDIQGLAVVSIKKDDHTVQEFTFDVDTLVNLLEEAAELVATTVAEERSRFRLSARPIERNNYGTQRHNRADAEFGLQGQIPS